MSNSLIRLERERLHSKLRGTILTLDSEGRATNADKDSTASLAIARHIVKALPESTESERLPGQTTGAKFEAAIRDFLEGTFLQLNHIRPGHWVVEKIGSKKKALIARFDQFAHLAEIADLAEDNPSLRAALGSDYLIAPDIVIARLPEPDVAINAPGNIVCGSVATKSPLRADNFADPMPLLHASISCKWTLRSDRAQNAKSEALNMIRNRKGSLPHIVGVTGEPMPSRISSLALGTGDLDCVYHIALPELIEATKAVSDHSAYDLVQIMVEGKRLRDISDLPLDLAI
jgi:hypothetical protein